MDHATATRQAIAEAYVLGELSEEERDRFEEHFFTCPECAADVKALTAFLDDARTVLAREPVSQRIARAVRRLFDLSWRPLPALPAAAALVLALGVAIYQSTVTVPSLRNELTMAQRPQATAWHFLTVARSESPVVRVSPDTRMIGLTLSRSGHEPYPYYSVDVRDASGATATSAVFPAPAAGDELQLLLPVSELRAGDYTLVLSGMDAPDGQVTAPDLVRYPFTLTHEES